MRPSLRSQGGFSIVPAIAMLGLLVMLGGVAVQEAIQALGSTRESELRKRALQTADAAIDSAAYSLSRGDLQGGVNIDPRDPGTVLNQTCLVGTGSVGGVDLAPLPTGTLPDPSGRRWCPATEPEVTPEGASSRFRVSELVRLGAGDCTGDGLLSLDREIVAVAQAGRSVRRVRARLRAAVTLLSGAAVQADSETAALQMTGAARVLGDVASNFDIVGAPTNVIGGSAIPGPGRTVSGVVPAGSTQHACSKFVLPDVDPGDTATVNHNTAISADCVNPSDIIAVPCKPLLITTGGTHTPASPAFPNSGPAKPVLHVWGNGRATLQGSTYSFCSIRLESQAQLMIKPSTPVTRVFLRAPADCAGVPNAGQLRVDGTARIINCHAGNRPETLQLYAIGHRSTPTTQTISGAGLLLSTALTTACGADLGLVGWPMVVYAPHSRVELGGSTTLAGQVAADTILMSGAAAVQPVNALVNLNRFGGRPVLPLYKPVEYVECTGRTFAELPPEDPAQGC